MNLRLSRPSRASLAAFAFPVGLGLLLLCVSVVYVYTLRALPAGFLPAEAEHGLLARESSGNGLAVMRDAGQRSPLLAALITLLGRPFGFDLLTARLAAALAGTLTAGLTALWLRRAFGPAWGLLGGLLLAGSFWPLVFSRLALSPIAGALALAALLWLLLEAGLHQLSPDRRSAAATTDRASGPLPSPWYALLAVAAALGFMADQPLRVMPVLLLIPLVFLLRQRPGRQERRTRGLGIAILLAVFLCAPYVTQALDQDASHLGFWQPTPGLGGQPVDSAGRFAVGYATAARRLVWPASGTDVLNLPGEPVLGMLLLPWAALGLLLALRRLHRPAVAAALLWGLVLLIPAAAVEPVHPGRLLVLLPLLVALPVAGMRTAYERAGAGLPRAVVVGLIALSLAGATGWSSWRFVDGWATQPETAAALSASLRDGLAAIEELPPGELVLFSRTGADQDRLLDYLAPGTDDRRVDFDGSQLLPLPLHRDGYLIVPQAAPLDPALRALVAATRTGGSAAPGAAYDVYRIDGRAREQLPLSIPTTSYVDGAAFLGHQLEPRGDGSLSILTGWRLPGDGQARAIRLRLRPSDVGLDQPARFVELPLPGDLVSHPHELVRLAILDAPPLDDSGTWELSVALLDARGEPLTGDGVGGDGYLFLNRYQFVR